MKHWVLNIIGILAVAMAAGFFAFYEKGKDMKLEMLSNDAALQETRWDLSTLYSSIDDPQIETDVARLEKLCADFMAFRGNLQTRLPEALTAMIEIDKISSPIGAYLYMRSSTDTQNQDIKKIMSATDERLSRASAAMAFFDIEVADMTDADYQKLLKNPIVARHKSLLDDIRKNKKYQLSEKEEILLSRLSPFGGGEWDDAVDEFEAGLDFDFRGKKYKLAEILEIMHYSENRDERRAAMKLVNATLKDSRFSWLKTRALNLVVGKKNTMDEIRGFTHAMQSRNLSNNLDDAVVDALHTAVREHGAPQLQRYFAIMQKFLGAEKLSWADRNANLPFDENGYVAWPDMQKTVMESYAAFSPAMAEIAQAMFDQRRLDAPNYPGKSNGAYSYTIIGRDGSPQSFIMLNSMGTTRDTMTLAHEMGHSVHGILAGRKQSPLTFGAPMAYAETASIFGEMLTFENILNHTAGDREKFILLMGKSKDWINTVSRQISFSLFEQRVHAARKDGKLAPADMNKIWVDVSREFYGDAFDYGDMDELWSYVGHFMRPFYVYSYAFGELFVQSLFAQKDKIPDFEKKYIEMLESGGTKNAVELMAPFGLDPRDPEFWNRGIDASITKWLDAATDIMQRRQL
ncbi:MAG: M3 family oligoendopeptidase [Rickettsiales bacterium]|jgi:oligoendopeptidase F|nr:M3 family oligoendopeptidase [Rickettsiales bacterium]